MPLYWGGVHVRMVWRQAVCGQRRREGTTSTIQTFSKLIQQGVRLTQQHIAAIHDIICTADSSTDFTFMQFYYGPFENSYATKVLSVVSNDLVGLCTQ